MTTNALLLNYFDCFVNILFRYNDNTGLTVSRQMTIIKCLVTYI